MTFVLAPLVVSALFPSLPLATVGKVQFPVSCNATAQAQFTRGISALHSFWYSEARTQFVAAEKSDPKCAMAFLGEAMSHLELLWVEDDVPAARAALARMPGEPPTARERAWLTAWRALVADGDPRPRRAAFAQAMVELVRQFPDDESKTFLALALLTASPEENLGNRARAAALSFEVTAHNPDHPGALHYAIHALDTPELAPLGLPAARRYAATAPEAFHARHMPAHIFTRLGMWQEALASCEAAWETSQRWVDNAKLPSDERDYHSLQWIIAISVELGHVHAAEAAMQRFLDGARHGSAGVRGWYGSVLVEYLRATGQWSRLAELSLPVEDDAAATAGPSCHGPAQLQHDRQSRAQADAQRWIAAARHDAKEVARLNAIIVAIRQRRAAEMEQWAGHEGALRLAQEDAFTDAALLATARGDAATAAARWRDRAALEDREPPDEGADALGGPRLLAGMTLLASGHAAEAKHELELALLRYPGHVATWLALGHALDALGDTTAARGYITRAADAWRGADAHFAPALEARAWLAAHPTTTAAR